MILGNNGYIWLCPTVSEETDQTGGYDQDLQVCLIYCIILSCNISSSPSFSLPTCMLFVSLQIKALQFS